jgi:hypothetical protein
MALHPFPEDSIALIFLQKSITLPIAILKIPWFPH